ncbi:MAG: hypothetical protein ACLQJR_06535 [Stellaceae bacterium]
MTTDPTSDPFDKVWDFPLFEALYGRRSRRFGQGFEIAEGPFRYRSMRPPVPLSEVEEPLLVAAGIGLTGVPLWDGSRPPTLRARDGRTYASTTNGARTALFFTNDRGVYLIDPAGICARKLREVETRDQRASVLDLYRQHRRRLGEGRLAIPRRVPPLFGHNLWDSNQPGSTLFMPVCDVSLALISLILSLVDGEGGRYVRGHGGGMSVVDDRHGCRPAGTERWLDSGYLDKGKVLPLSILERQACYFMFSEPAVICHNIFLATEALGVGGWMHCGFLSLEVMQALGFRMVDPVGAPAFANPVGVDGVFEGYCPPYFASMDAAVDAAVVALGRGATAPAPYTMPEAEHRGAIAERISDTGLACTKAICRYIHQTYGRFPAGVDTMHLMWLMQAHHLDLDYYARFFHPGACGETHVAHMATWHPEIYRPSPGVTPSSA